MVPVHRATLELATDDPVWLARTLGIEADDGPEGTTCTLNPAEGTLRMVLEAPDASTLRAAIHSMLRLADAAQRV